MNELALFAGVGKTAIAEKPEMVRSVYFDQTEILRGIMKLHSPEGFDCEKPSNAIAQGREPGLSGEASLGAEG
jgi:hypothetical protein